MIDCITLFSENQSVLTCWDGFRPSDTQYPIEPNQPEQKFLHIHEPRQRVLFCNTGKMSVLKPTMTSLGICGISSFVNGNAAIGTVAT